MGDSFSGFDASKYMYASSWSNPSTYSSQDGASPETIENVDLSGAAPTSSSNTDTSSDSSSSSKTTIENYVNVRGDANGDGVVDIMDVTAIQQSLVGKGNVAYGMGDLDGDGNVSIKDVTILQQYLAGNTKSVEYYASFAEAEMQNFGYLDINKDGKIDDIDAGLLDTYMVAGDNSGNPIRLYLNTYKNKIKYPFSSDSVDMDDLMAEFGDYDGDGLVTNKDVTAMQRDIASSGSGSGDKAEIYENGELVSSSDDKKIVNYKCDLNGDGTVDSKDAEILSNYLAGKDVKSSIDPNKIKYMYYEEAGEYSMEGVAATLATKTSAYLDYMYDTGNSDQAAAQAYNQWEQSYRESNPGVEPSLSDYAGIKDGTCVDNRAKIDEIRGEMLKYNNFNKSYTNNASKYEEYKSDLLNIMQLKTTNPDLAELKETYLSYKSLQDYLENKRDIYNDWKEHPENYSSEPPEFTSADLQLLSSATSYTSSLKNKIDLGGIDYNSEFGTTEFYEFCNNYDPNNAPADDKYASVEKYLKKVNSTLKPEYQMTAGALYKSVKDEGGPTGLSVDACRELEYIDEEYIMMYHYLLQTKGKDYADKYFEYNKLDIVANQNEGLEDATFYIKNLKRIDIDFDDYMKDRVNVDDDEKITRADYDKLYSMYHNGEISEDDGAKYDINADGVFDDADLTYLDRYLKGENISGEIDYQPLDMSDLGVTMVEGYADGVEYYVDGVKYRLDDSNIDKPSVHDYRNMYIMQYLESKKAQSLKKTYNVSYSIGNMSIPMAASAITYAATKNEKAGKFAGLMLMKVSLQGNYKHEAMLEGHSAASSELYAMLASDAEVITEYYLGGIPFFSRFEGNILTGGVLEGAQEYVQTWIQQGIKSAVFGEPIDISAVHGEATEAFDSGAITGILLGGGGKIIHVAIDGITYEVDSNALANISNNGTQSVSVEQLRSIATIDPDVQQVSQDYGYTNEEASTILTVVNAYTLYDNPDISSLITNTDIMNTLNYLKKTNNTKVYNKILCNLTNEQYAKIKNDPNIPDQGLPYSKQDLFADRMILEKSCGKYVEMNSSQQEIDAYTQDNDSNSYNSNYEAVLQTLSDKNITTIEKEILKKVTPDMSQIEIARLVYYELGKKVDYSEAFKYSNTFDEETFQELYGRQMTMEDLESDGSIICVNWAQLYSKVLMDAGFRSDQIVIQRAVDNNGNYMRGSHAGIYVVLDDGTIIMPDLTAPLGTYDDAYNVKMNNDTTGFIVFTPDQIATILAACDSYDPNGEHIDAADIEEGDYTTLIHAMLQYDDDVSKVFTISNENVQNNPHTGLSSDTERFLKIAGQFTFAAEQKKISNGQRLKLEGMLFKWLLKDNADVLAQADTKIEQYKSDTSALISDTNLKFTRSDAQVNLYRQMLENNKIDNSFLGLDTLNDANMITVREFMIQQVEAMGLKYDPKNPQGTSVDVGGDFGGRSVKIIFTEDGAIVPLTIYKDGKVVGEYHVTRVDGQVVVRETTPLYRSVMERLNNRKIPLDERAILEKITPEMSQADIQKLCNTMLSSGDISTKYTATITNGTLTLTPVS